MNPFDERRQQALEALAQEAAAEAGPHPAAAVLEAYAEGRLEEAETVEVRAHVALCPTCGDLVQALAEAAELEPGSVLSEVEMAEDLGRLQGLWAEDGGEPSDFPSEVSAVAPVAEVPAGRDWAWSRLAASLAVGLLLGLLWGHERRSGPPIETPPSQPNPQIVELLPEGSGITRGPEDMEPATRGPLIFSLATVNARPEELYEVSIRCQGRLILNQGELRRMPGGDLRLQVDRGVLPPGECRLELYLSSSKPSGPLETYRYQIPPDDSP